MLLLRLIAGVLISGIASMAIGDDNWRLLKTIATFEMARDSVHVLRFSPDGKTLAVTTHEGLVKLLDAGTLKESALRIKERLGVALSLAFSPDGKLLAACGFDFHPSGSTFGVVKVWDTDTGKLIKVLQASNSGEFRSLAFSPDGQQLVAGDAKSFVTLWNITSGARSWSVKTHDEVSYVSAILMSPDGKSVLAGHVNGNIMVLESKTGKPERTLDGHLKNKNILKPDIRSLTILKDGTTLVSADGNGFVCLTHWGTRQLQRSFRVTEGELNDLCVSPDETWMAVSLFRNIRIINLVTGRKLGDLEGHIGQLRTARIASHGVIASANNFDTRLWAPPTKPATAGK